MQDCIFCRIVEGSAPCHRIWEDDEHLAFLSIYPNTPGFSVVIPKHHYPSYAFALPDDVLHALIAASKKVALRIDAAFEDVGRTGLILEGFGVDHVHAKLVPMHGTALDEWKRFASNIDTYFERYEGYLSSHDSKRADDAELERIARLIRGS